MKSIDFTTALGRLLTDAELLSAFTQNPSLVADQLNVAKEVRAYFVTLSPQQVATQAKLLITKRMKEVYKFLPYTFQTYPETAQHFKTYASTYWPKSYRRHLEDAHQFCLYLKTHHLFAAQSEFNRIRFLQSGKRFRLTWATDVLIKGQRLPALQVFYRNKKTDGQWRFYIGNR